MKYLISSITIGACLLLSSAGDVFAVQQGTGGTGVASCGSSITIGLNTFTQASPPGQANNTTTNNSPFPVGVNGVVNMNGAVSKYAGAGKGNYGAGQGGGAGTPNANSQYDVACLQHLQLQVP